MTFSVEIIFSAMLSLVVTLLGFLAKQSDSRIKALEVWRIEHEKYTRDEMIIISSRLATIEAKLDELLGQS